MAETTNIAWTDATFNPVIGCTKVSPACDHCYAEAWAKRSGLVEWGNNPRRRTSQANWNKVRKMQREADKFEAEHSRRRRVFCASLADVFDNKWEDEWRDDLWDLIRECDRLDFQLLTKRPRNIAKMLPHFWPEIAPHVWLGTTVENMEELERRSWPLTLYGAGAAVRFYSVEPMLERMILDKQRLATGINWVICGGESGPGHRPMNPEWVRSLRDQCKAAGVAFFFKQWGGARPDSGGHLLNGEVVREFPRQA